MADISSITKLIVVSDKGGIGKDLIAALVHRSARLRELDPKPIEVETAESREEIAVSLRWTAFLRWTAGDF